MHDPKLRTLVQALILALLPAGAALAGPVNLNSADASTLAKELDGIGPAKAQAIVEYRQKNGPFRSPEGPLPRPLGKRCRSPPSRRRSLRAADSSPAEDRTESSGSSLRVGRMEGSLRYPVSCPAT